MLTAAFWLTAMLLTLWLAAIGVVPSDLAAAFAVDCGLTYTVLKACWGCVRYRGKRSDSPLPSGSWHSEGAHATRGKERKPFSDCTKKEKSAGLTTSETICAKGGNPQEWKGIPPANPGGGGKEGPFPIRTWSLCKESPVGRNCCAGRSCRTQPTIGNGRLGQADDGVRLEDLNNPDKVEGALKD